MKEEILVEICLWNLGMFWGQGNCWWWLSSNDSSLPGRSFTSLVPCIKSSDTTSHCEKIKPPVNISKYTQLKIHLSWKTSAWLCISWSSGETKHTLETLGFYTSGSQLRLCLRVIQRTFNILSIKATAQLTYISLWRRDIHINVF